MSSVTKVSGIHQKEGLWVLCINPTSSDGRGPRADVALPVVNSSPSGSVLSNGLCRPGRGGHRNSDSAFFPSKMTQGLLILPQWPKWPEGKWSQASLGPGGT